MIAARNGRVHKALYGYVYVFIGDCDWTLSVNVTARNTIVLYMEMK